MDEGCPETAKGMLETRQDNRSYGKRVGGDYILKSVLMQGQVTVSAMEDIADVQLMQTELEGIGTVEGQIKMKQGE